MAGIGGRWCLLIVALYCGQPCTANRPDTLCPKPAVPKDAMLVTLHSNVSLTCPGCEGSVSWRRRSRPGIPQQLEVTESGHLVVESVTYEDEDGYTCYKDGAPLCTVELIVKDERQDNANLLCYHRHPTHNITCQWSPSKLLHPSSNITLIKVRVLEHPLFFPCTYDSTQQTVSCSSLYKEGDSKKHVFSLCVRGRTDSALTATLEAYVKDLLHVGPPLNVRVTPVLNHPRKLQVSWSRPEFWEKTFYYLKYQVLYRVENSPHQSNVTTMDLSFVIDDAVMGRKHLIRVRASEEYQKNWGSWSEEAEGTPWSDGTTDTEDVSTTSDITEHEYEDEEPMKDLGVPRRFAWIAPCVCLGLVLLFFFGIWMRYQEIRIVKLKWGVVRSLFRSSTKVNTTQPPACDPLLMSPASSPSSVTVTIPPSLDGE